MCKYFIVQSIIAHNTCFVKCKNRMSNAYDPTRRPWFARAVASKGKICISTPYLDASGSGLMNTISTTVFDNRDVQTGEIIKDKVIVTIWEGTSWISIIFQNFLTCRKVIYRGDLGGFQFCLYFIYIYAL